MAYDLINYNPMYIEEPTERPTKYKVRNTEWNSLWRLATLQSNNTASALKALIDKLNTEIWQPSWDTWPELSSAIIDLSGEGRTNETVKGNADALAAHVATLLHITPEERTAWNAKYDSGNLPYYFGTYDGDGTSSRTIPLPFTPSAVLLFGNGSAVSYYNSAMYGGLAFTASTANGISNSDAIVAFRIVANGFTVYYNFGSSLYTNKSGMKYHYIAFK